MTEKTRTERRLLESIRQVKTGDEAAATDSAEKQADAPTKPDSRTPRQAAAGNQPPAPSMPKDSTPAPAKPRTTARSTPATTSIKGKPRSTTQTMCYQSPGRVWPD